MPLINLLSGTIPFERCILGLGTFDGLHLGHQELVKSLLKASRDRSLPAVVFTFDHPPRRILSPEKFPGEITNPEEKFSLLLSSGVDTIVFRKFDEEFAAMLPSNFIKNIVVDALRAKMVYVGFNFGFGLRREGNPEYLTSKLKQFDVETRIIPSVEFDGQTVSSSNIRRLIKIGELSKANQLLGREASFSGIVIHGDRRGKKMGFPTANLSLENTTKVLPPHGVYLSVVDTPGGVFHSIVNIGIRPTFDRNIPVLEAHLLNFDDDLYDRTIRVRFIQRLREEIRFPTMEALMNQIQIDLTTAENIVKKETVAL